MLRARAHRDGLTCAKITIASYSFLAARPSISWDDAPVDEPLLLYHDEIQFSPNCTVTPTERSLVCMGGEWHYPNVSNISELDGPFCQSDINSSHRILLRNMNVSGENPTMNGVWTCRYERQFFNATPVGLYSRGMGEESFDSHNNRQQL